MSNNSYTPTYSYKWDTFTYTTHTPTYFSWYVKREKELDQAIKKVVQSRPKTREDCL